MREIRLSGSGEGAVLSRPYLIIGRYCQFRKRTAQLTAPIFPRLKNSVGAHRGRWSFLRAKSQSSNEACHP